MKTPGIKNLLQEIISGDIEWVYIHITQHAVEWAAAGFIEEANNLLDQLWKFNISHSRNLWLNDEGLQVMWEVSGKRPDKIPFQMKDISEIEKENWERNFYPVWNTEYIDKLREKSLDELDGHELFVKAIIVAGEQSESNIKILDALKRFIENSTNDDYTYFQATTCGALLAANQNQDELAKYFIREWGKAYLNENTKITLSYLMRYRKTASYLQQEILRDVFNTNSNLCKEETEQIIEALTKRMASGRTLVYGALSWSELLNEISKLAIEKKTMEFTEDILEKGTLIKPPASTKEIEATENRLNITLPEVYKEFLLTSNGFECFSSTGVTLSAVDNVDYLKTVDPQLIHIWTTSMDGIDPVFCKKLKNSIIIGGHQEEQQLLLVPGEESDWECWHFSSWRPGEAAYQDFRFYMEEELQWLENEILME